MKTWQQVLARIGSVGDQTYGPNTATLGGVILALQDAQLCSRVGTASPLDHTVVRAASWAEALMVFVHDASRVAGVLMEPTCEMDRVRALAPERLHWLKGAWSLLTSRVVLAPPEPPGVSDETALWLTDYVYDFAKSVVIEVLHDDLTTCTFFREQLQWFCAGYFPCGWEGDWPSGKMRVF